MQLCMAVHNCACSFSYCAKLLQSELPAPLLSYELCKVNSLGKALPPADCSELL